MFACFFAVWTISVPGLVSSGLQSGTVPPDFQYERSAPLGERDSVIVEVRPERKFSWGIE